MPNTPAPGTFTADQEALAAGMRTAWAAFAAAGDPTSSSLTWPALRGAASEMVMSLVAPQPEAKSDFAATHHCGFWNAG
jgi:para-nitrobenzyl esterase